MTVPVSAGEPASLPPRVVGRLEGSAPGPTLVVMAGVHGNEPAGIEGARRALRRLEASDGLRSGELVVLVGNRAAVARGVRCVEEDLNRLWTRRGAGSPWPDGVERREAGELAEILEGVGARARGPVYGLDLHTTSSEGAAFAVVPDGPRHHRFAACFGVPRVLGLEELVEGTLLRELDGRGWVAAVLEAGHHEDPGSVERCEAAVHVACRELRLAAGEGRGRKAARWARKRLARAGRGLPRVVQLRYRHAIMEPGALHLHPGLRNFQPVRSGERLGDFRGAPVRAPEDGLLLMPLYQSVGNDGFFIVRPVGSGRATFASGFRGALGRIREHPGVRRLEGWLTEGPRETVRGRTDGV